jgi:hypothetical protein
MSRKLSDLTKTLATALGQPLASVNVVAMMLRKDRLLSSTGRGHNAAEMAPRDVANLLLGCLVEAQVRELAALVGALRLQPIRTPDDGNLLEIEVTEEEDDEVGFGDVLARLIERYDDDWSVAVSVWRTPGLIQGYIGISLVEEGTGRFSSSYIADLWFPRRGEHEPFYRSPAKFSSENFFEKMYEIASRFGDKSTTHMVRGATIRKLRDFLSHPLPTKYGEGA